MSTPRTSPPYLPAILELFLDGLDASVDGRGWNVHHQRAHDFIVNAISSHNDLVAVARRWHGYDDDQHRKAMPLCSDCHIIAAAIGGK